MQFDPSSIFLVEIFRFPELSLCRQIISHFTQQWTLQDAHWNTVERTPVLHFSSFFFFKIACRSLRSHDGSRLPTVAVGKCVSKSRRGAFFAAFLHNSSSPFAARSFPLLFLPRLLRPLAIRVHSFEFQASPRGIWGRGAERRVFVRAPSIFDMHSHIESRRVSAYACATRRHVRIRAYVRTVPTSWRAPNVGVALSRV